MFTKPAAGWTRMSVTMEKEYSKEITVNWDISYLSNFPLELLTALVNLYKTKMPQVIKVELESKGEGTIIISLNDMEIVNLTCIHPTIYRLPTDVDMKDILEEMYEDIYSNINDWSSYYCGIEDEESLDANKTQIKHLLSELKDLMDKHYK